MSIDFAALSDAIADLVARSSVSLVTVHGGGRRASTGVAWSADGLVFTAAHALEREDDLAITLPSGERTNVTLVGVDPSTDLALLRVEATLTPPRWAEASGVRPGHLVLAMGRPRGEASATLGLIRAVGGAWRSPGGGQIDAWLDVDGELPRGFSGGILLDARGAALGLNTAGLVRGGTTVPSASLARVATSLLTHGRVQRAWLGLGAVPASLPRALAEAAGSAEALLVVSVEAGGPAEQAGVIVGDLLLSFAGAKLARLPDLVATLGEERVGKPTPLRLLRGGAPLELSLTPGARAASCC